MPEGWCWSTIGDTFTLQAGKFIQASDIHELSPEYLYPCYGGNGIRGFVSEYNREGVYPIIGRQGALCGNINYATGKFYATEHAVVVETYGGTDVNWARYLLEELDLNQYATATAQPGLSVKTINEVPFPLPPSKEQRRIASCLKSTLESISHLEELTTSLGTSVTMIKAKVLDLAIHGKLVPQDPSDEPALKLLKRINPAFTPSHNLHYGVVPQGWALCLLGTVTNYGQCVSVQTDDLLDSDWILELEDIEKGSGRLLQRLQKKDRTINGIRHRFIKGQVLYPKLRTYLNKVLIAEDDGFCTTEIVPITPCQAITSQYLNVVLRSPYFLDYTARCGYGVKMPRLGTNDAKKAVIPVPPLPEQKRIVTAVDNIFEKLESIVEILK